MLGLATEDEPARLFPDCERGAIPPVGAAYGIDSIVDEAVLSGPQVYLEAGDQAHLLRRATEQFAALVGNAWRGRFSHPI